MKRAAKKNPLDWKKLRAQREGKKVQRMKWRAKRIKCDSL